MIIRNNERILLPCMVDVFLHGNDRVIVETPGGGGWGQASESNGKEGNTRDV